MSGVFCFPCQPLFLTCVSSSPHFPPSPSADHWFGRFSQRLASAAAPSKLADRLLWTSAKRGFCFVSRFINEAYTSVTCVRCRKHNKPHGRVYACSGCGLRAHRDIMASANIAIRTIARHRLLRHGPLADALGLGATAAAASFSPASLQVGPKPTTGFHREPSPASLVSRTGPGPAPSPASGEAPF